VCIQANIQQLLMYALSQHKCADIQSVQSVSLNPSAVSCRKDKGMIVKKISQVLKVVQSMLHAVISATLVGSEWAG